MEFETLDQKRKNSIFFVECTSFEYMCLWEKFHKETNWKDGGEGMLRTIGFISNHKSKPVSLHFTFAKIYDQRICFYDITSRYVDYTMIDEYIDKNYCVEGVSRSSADRFGYVVNCCKEIFNEKKKVSSVG